METRTYADRREYRRAWYRSRKAKKLCYACTAPAAPGKILCPVCHEKRRRRERAEAKWPEDRETRRKSWQNIDWNLPTWRIAELMEVTESTVRKQRNKICPCKT
jgi:hypothetical protein